MAVIVGLGTGSGASPFFLDNSGAQQRAQSAAQASARNEIQHALALAACPKCGQVDPAALRQRRQRAVFIAVIVTLAGLLLGAAATRGDLLGWSIGGAVGLVLGVIMAMVGFWKETPVVFESAAPAPVRTAR